MNSQFEITIEEWHETSRDGAGIPIKLSQVWGIVTKKEKNARETNLDSAFSRFYGKLWMSTLGLRNALRIIRNFIKSKL